MFYRRVWLSVISLAMCGLPGSLMADVSPFRFDPDKVETGVVYQYWKSNIDDSNRGHVSLYVAEKDRLESLKWHEGGSTATLVIARMDWKRFSVRHFDTLRLGADDEPQRIAVLDYEPKQGLVIASAGDTKLQVKIDNWPWHSYDFDLASLNFAWRHLVDPRSSFKVGITDAVRTPHGPKLVDKGEVGIVYKRDTVRHSHNCYEYLIDGPGLEHQGGRIWIRKEDGIMVDYEIALPDEAGFTDGKLQLASVDRMTAKEWERYKTSRLSSSK